MGEEGWVNGSSWARDSVVHWNITPWKPHHVLENLGEKRPFRQQSKSGYPITAQAPIADSYPIGRLIQPLYVGLLFCSVKVRGLTAFCHIPCPYVGDWQPPVLLKFWTWYMNQSEKFCASQPKNFFRFKMMTKKVFDQFGSFFRFCRRLHNLILFRILGEDPKKLLKTPHSYLAVSYAKSCL